ncbi:MAG: MotA/TolQ/ExbB proton channel family protein [Planctomycetaceae bacterium]
MVKQHVPDLIMSLQDVGRSSAGSALAVDCHTVDSRAGGGLPRQQLIAVFCLIVASCWPVDLLAQPPEESLVVNPPTTAQAGNPAAADPTTTRQGIPGDLTGIISALGVWFVSPFVVASIVALWFSIERLVILRHGRVLPRPFIERFLQHLQQQKLDPQTALQLCEENGSPVASVFAHGCRKWGKPSVEVEQAIIDGGERQVSHLRKHLRVINGVATITPLIGLLGTVVGMIQAFNQIANTDAMGKAQELAVGIALALLTTAIGLVIAIPSLTVYMYLAGKVDALVMEMDHLAQNVVHLISAEGLASQGHRRATGNAGSKSKR